MNLESSPLFGGVISRAAQGNHRVEGILTAAGPSLATIHTGMVHEEHGDALPPEP